MTAQQQKNLFRDILIAQRTIAQEIAAFDSLVDFITQAVSAGISGWTNALTFNTTGAGAGAFCTYPDINNHLRFWKTKVDGNINHKPNTDPLVTEDSFWKEVSPSDGSAIKEWAAGIYPAGLVIVYYDITGTNPSLYKLTDPTRPFTSSDFVAELTAGKWAKMTSDIGDVLDAVRGYVLMLDGSQAMQADIDMNNHVIKQVSNATTNDEAVNLGQLNAAIDGLKPKSDCVVATTANITLNDVQTIDGVAVVAGNRVLVKDQTTPTENGIYDVVAGGDWARSSDSDTNIELQGAFVQVTSGTINGNTAWVQYTVGITIGTSNILWRQISSSVPDATSTVKGKAKLFATLGSGTDGAPDQNTVTRKLQDSSSTNGTATGTDTYVVTLSPAIPAYVTGQVFEILFTNANTTAATININGLGAKAIKKNVSQALVANDIQAGQILNVAYDGTNFQIIGGSVAQATSSQAGIAKLYTALGTNTDGSIDQATAKTNFDLKAPLASPALTGTPTAPTAANGTNTTQLATTAFVKAAIDLLINSAPGALDTLKELADALGDDANYAATMTALLALKAPLASPALTGTPTAPTGAAADASTQIANNAFVQQEITRQNAVANAAAKLYLFNGY